MLTLYDMLKDAIQSNQDSLEMVLCSIPSEILAMRIGEYHELVGGMKVNRSFIAWTTNFVYSFEYIFVFGRYRATAYPRNPQADAHLIEMKDQ